MEKKLTTAEFDAWVQSLKEYRPRELYNVFRKWDIGNTPDGETVMLAAVKHGDAFIDDLDALGLPPASINLHADGESKLKDFFTKALGTVATVATAVNVFGKKSSSDSSGSASKPPPDEDDENFEIFGKKVPKTYVYAGIALALVTGVYLYMRKGKS